MRVLAALSGGVDSAVAAARVIDAGHDVVGMHMDLVGSRGGERGRGGDRPPSGLDGQGCHSPEHIDDARHVANVLGIPFEVWDLSDQFEQLVVADFLAEYRAGRTPNPCVRCNLHIKFGVLLDRATALGFDAVCTGHYARIRTVSDGSSELHRARTVAKDQSYVLAVMGPQRLSRAMFPLGDVASKQDVRGEAVARGLPVAATPDSFDICFIPDGDTQGFLRSRLGARPGDVVDTAGNVVGHHDGAYAYTVGQRRGLRLGRPAADGRPRYVVDVRPATNVVVVGAPGELDVIGLRGEAAVWWQPAAHDWFDCEAQVRAHGVPIPCRARAVWADDGVPSGLEVRLGAPLRGLAAGQSAVLYDDTRVLAQAIVVDTQR